MIGTHAFTDASLSHMQLWTQTFPSSFSQVLGTRAVSDAMVKFVHVSHKEEALMRKCHSEGMGVRKISALTGRSFETVSKHVFKKHRNRKPQPKGRPRVITAATLKRLIKAHEKLLRENPRAEVTIRQVKAAVGLECADRTILNAFHKHGLYFRTLYEKPEITSVDRTKRMEFADAHGARTAAQWNTYLHAVIDNKTFQVYKNGKARDHAARRRIRGVYRTRRRVYTKGNTKPPGALKKNTGAKSVMVTCALGAGRVIMWHVVPDNKWNANAAEDMYTNALHPRLQHTYPSTRRFRVLEDNDPAGYKSRKGEQAKRNLRIDAVSLPPRSPDLNPLDYTVWAEINRRMRSQEKAWPAGKSESRAQFLQRLRRTAMGLPPAYINKAIGNLTKRIALMKTARGGHFPEGGL